MIKNSGAEESDMPCRASSASPARQARRDVRISRASSNIHSATARYTTIGMMNTSSADDEPRPVERHALFHSTTMRHTTVILASRSTMNVRHDALAGTDAGAGRGGGKCSTTSTSGLVLGVGRRRCFGIGLGGFTAIASLRAN